MTNARDRLLAQWPSIRRDNAALAAPAAWGLSELSGRLSELCAVGAGAALTFAFGLVLDAQRRGEPVAWIMDERGGFFPPDAAEGGVDLDALVVVRAKDAPSIGRAADHLARSGAFGLLIVDLLGVSAEDMPMPILMRLLGLAQKHDAAIVFVDERTRADVPFERERAACRGERPDVPFERERAACRGERPAPLGSLISLRAEARRQVRTIDDVDDGDDDHEGDDGDGRFMCELRVIKDKRRGPGFCHREVCRGPAGLR